MEVSGQLYALAALPPRKRAPGTYWIGGWVGPRAGLDAVSKRKIPSLRRESNPYHPIVQPVASRYTNWVIPASSSSSSSSSSKLGFVHHQLVKNMDQWQVLVNMVTNLRVL
jgi:hypothetical protein